MSRKKTQPVRNRQHAALHTPLFRQRVEKKQKGKGSYTRKSKHPRGYRKAA